MSSRIFFLKVLYINALKICYYTDLLWGTAQGGTQRNQS